MHDEDEYDRRTVAGRMKAAPPAAVRPNAPQTRGITFAPREPDADTDDAGSRTAETTFGGGGSGLVAQPYGNSSNSTITTAPLLNVVIDVPNRNSDRFVEVALNQASGNTGVIIRKADAIELVAEEPTDTPNDEPKHTPHSASNTQDKVLKETT
jgi:hypothetical protein